VAPRPGEAWSRSAGARRDHDAALERCRALTVIELDRDLAARLRRTPGLEVIEADVLRVDFAALAVAGGGNASSASSATCPTTSRRRSCSTCCRRSTASPTST
jgi:hypothetical protein